MPAQEPMAFLAVSCRFPDAPTPQELWRNAMEGRRSFREIPIERLDIGQYAAGLVGEVDSITPIRAGLLTNWRFDRANYRVPLATYETTDLTHWLSLELAAEALAELDIKKLDRSRTAVVVANTLTGEFSRSSLLRHRLPFMDGVLAQIADSEGLDKFSSNNLRRAFANEIRQRFPDPNEDSLAGGLANTIAGRIANYFDFRGGAYTVDAACASSLVAVADAASLLATHQADAVVVGAVDLSLDPFELVGFSRNGALARADMRVFDVQSNGFWPGEGGAFAILMRESDAKHLQFERLATMRGYGLSTDGAGGLTRPSHEGQLAAYRRAYENASVDPQDVAFVEAHGTGTAVGDPIEIRALAQLRPTGSKPLPIGSIKSNIGHTKAAAGFAGLIKTIEALRRGLLPPHVGCREPHPAFDEAESRIVPALSPQILAGNSVLAGVSSFGFGGINAHVVLERTCSTASSGPIAMKPNVFDAELFLFAGTATAVTAELDRLLVRAPSVSVAELQDASLALSQQIGQGPLRLAIVASNGCELADRLALAKKMIATGQDLIDRDKGIFLGCKNEVARIGFVFPGQAAPSRPDGGLWVRCFDDLRELLRVVPRHAANGTVATEIAQPAIVAASMAGLSLLERAGVKAEIALGHSLGEISALAWGRVLTSEAAVSLAAKRGAIMARDARPGGRMLRVALPVADAEAIAATAEGVVVACENGANETVLAGPGTAIDCLRTVLERRQISNTPLATSHAFHSPDMMCAVPALRKVLTGTGFGHCERAVLSTVTGDRITDETNICELLTCQLTRRVRFDAAIAEAARDADLFIEVGPGQGLSRILRQRGLEAISIDAFGPSLAPFLLALGELHARGHTIATGPLFAERPSRAFDFAVPTFLANPCGCRSSGRAAVTVVKPIGEIHEPTSDCLAAVLSTIATQTALPEGSFGPDDRFLDNLHLNSLAVSRIVTAAAKTVGARSPQIPTDFANATPRTLASALEELREFASADPQADRISGVRHWVDTYAMCWSDLANDVRESDPIKWSTIALSDGSLHGELPASPNGWCLQILGPFSRTLGEALIAVTAEAARRGVEHLAIVHERSPVSAFARSLAMEKSFRTVRVLGGIGRDCDGESIAKGLRKQTGRLTELMLDRDSSFKRPVFVPLRPPERTADAIRADDVVLVIGGGRGIASECALQLGRKAAGLILVGRSPAENDEVRKMLERAERANVRCLYANADACKRAELQRALQPAFEAIGEPTVLVHAAGLNEPMTITKVDADTASRCLAPKMDAFSNAVAASGPWLRRVVTFGSLIGRIGLEGEAHYALANAALTDAALAWAGAEPNRSALALEWSIWGGVGMGERLGTIDRLAALGVDPIPVDEAVANFVRLVESGASGPVTVTSRFGMPPDLSLGPSDLPSLRFVDHPLLYYPGKEIVIETSLSRGRDRYLDDHVVAGQRVFPGVMALEAMAQAASCLGNPQIGVIEGISFDRAIQINDAEGMTIRLAALKVGENIEAAIFATDDSFRVPAARAVFKCGPKEVRLSGFDAPSRSANQDFEADALYGKLFFNAGRFRRIDRFLSARSREVVATLRPKPDSSWFGSYEAQDTTLWDPGAADACMHALQVAVPHRRVVPIAIAKIEFGEGDVPVRVRAIEREASSGVYVFDMHVEDREGRVVQRWFSAKFHSIEAWDAAPAIACEAKLAAPFLERTVREALGDDSIEVAIVCDRTNSRDNRRVSALEMLRLANAIDYRVDGRPLRHDGEGSVTFSHHNGTTLAVAAKGQIGCDIEGSAAGKNRYQFAAMEACLKIGRRITPDRMTELRSSEVFRIDEMDVLILDLPEQAGFQTVAFSSIQKGQPNDRAR